eukprot:Filipodium_phascolosomae@DN33_c0_g1_i1.p1
MILKHNFRLFQQARACITPLQLLQRQQYEVDSKLGVNTVFVSGIGATNEEQLVELFNPIGKVTAVDVFRTPEKTPRGCAVVSFEEAASMKEAISKMDGSSHRKYAIKQMGVRQERATKHQQRSKLFVIHGPKVTEKDLRSCIDRMLGSQESIVTVDSASLKGTSSTVLFSNPDDAFKAMQKLNQLELKDVQMTVRYDRFDSPKEGN